ncbi:MAG TPA: MaoC/PaaZ C-terminal domain-containing protein [Microthrixaceae bacterium]|jgi:acyl dehydratase|nr:MaoC/PaaZ C-terminal domain-containing protein [Microthrixaceae bacterium]
MPINPDAVGSRSEPATSSWTSKDGLLYAVGVGAGQDPLNRRELPFVSENSIDLTQRILPTMVVTLPNISGVFSSIGSFNPAMLVHGEERVVLHREVPVSGTVSTVAEITAIWDKGKGAVVEVTSRSTLVDETEPLFEVVMSSFIRGEGDFGGERGPSGPRNVVPDRDPDASVTAPTRPEQALVYRLSGDRNPLHSDPSFAAMAGFDRPILHGLCTYGFTGRLLLHELCGSDPARFRSMDGRFSSPVMPGEELTVQVWRTGDGAAVFRTLASGDRVVLDSGAVTFDA